MAEPIFKFVWRVDDQDFYRGAKWAGRRATGQGLEGTLFQLPLSKKPKKPPFSPTIDRVENIEIGNAWSPKLHNVFVTPTCTDLPLVNARYAQHRAHGRDDCETA